MKGREKETVRQTYIQTDEHTRTHLQERKDNRRTDRLLHIFKKGERKDIRTYTTKRERERNRQTGIGAHTHTHTQARIRKE